MLVVLYTRARTCPLRRERFEAEDLDNSMRGRNRDSWRISRETWLQLSVKQVY